MTISTIRLTREPFDQRDNARDYQDPPENHKNPTEPAKRRKSKDHHIVYRVTTIKRRRPSCLTGRPPSPHHIHHRHPAAADCRKCRRSVATLEPFAHDNMDLFLAVLTVSLNHHG